MANDFIGGTAKKGGETGVNPCAALEHPAYGHEATGSIRKASFGDPGVLSLERVMSLIRSLCYYWAYATRFAANLEAQALDRKPLVSFY